MIVRRLAIAVLALPLIACSEPTVSDRGIDVTLIVDRTVLRPGETAQVTVVATNHGERAVTINSGTCPAAFVVIDQGRELMPGPSTCTAVLVTRELGPGESYTFHHAWTLSLASGSYALQGRVIGNYLKALSSPVEIRVEAGQ